MKGSRHTFVASLAVLAALGPLLFWGLGRRATAEQETGSSSNGNSHGNSRRDSQRKSAPPLDDRTLSAALCSVVYPVDRSPSPRGYHYLFYGNAFFINTDGYLITVAHVLSQLHGGQPYVLLRIPSAAPQFVPAAVVAIDRDHDIAILRAAPNPFDGKFKVSFLPIDHEIPGPGERVVAAALRPFTPRDSYTLEASLEERSPGDVLNLKFSQLDKGRAETELFLFNHKVQPGQSGAPVLSLSSHEVVGLVEGQWLRPENEKRGSAQDHATHGPSQTDAAAETIVSEPGAVIPMHYAIALLQQKNIEWHSTDENPEDAAKVNDGAAGFSPAIPYSVIPAAFPSQSLAGDEVSLDALVNRNGAVADIRVVSGAPPFVDAAVASVRTWTFLPARAGGTAGEARVAIVFQFQQPYIPARVPKVRHHEGPPSFAEESRAAIALTTIEPQYPSDAGAASGSVILFETIDDAGKIKSVQTVLDSGQLTDAVITAAQQWSFAPAMQSGKPIESSAIVVMTFREPLVVGRER